MNILLFTEKNAVEQLKEMRSYLVELHVSTDMSTCAGSILLHGFLNIRQCCENCIRIGRRCINQWSK